MSPQGVLSLTKPASNVVCRPRKWVASGGFQDIANTNGMTATALRVFLTTSHPKMPNLILTPEELADVTAFILSLRERR